MPRLAAAEQRRMAGRDALQSQPRKEDAEAEPKKREFLGGGYLFDERPATKSEAYKGGHRTKEEWSGKRRKGKGEVFRSAGWEGRGGRKRR